MALNLSNLFGRGGSNVEAGPAAEIVLAATGRPDGPEIAIVDAADYTVWRDNLRTSTPPPGILPYLEQSNLVGEGKFTASEDQLQTLVGRLQERGLIDTSTGEIVWADEATANSNGSDEELGALIAWLRTAQPGSSESSLDAGFTIADDLVNEARAGRGYIGETEKNVVSPDSGDDAARSMQPDSSGHGFTSAEGRSMSFELFSGGGPGPGPESHNLPEVGDEVIVSMLNDKNPDLTTADRFHVEVDGKSSGYTVPVEPRSTPVLGVDEKSPTSTGDQPELQLVDGGVEHEDTWQGTARSMQPGGQGQGFMMQDGELYPRGLLLPYMEQDNLYQGTDAQVAEVIGHLRERGLIDTSTGEIVWADEATANATGSDEELGALVAWLRGNNLIDTSTGEIVWARQPGTSGWFVPEMDSDQSGMAIENARSMQPGQQGEGFMMELDRQVPDAVVEDASDNILNVRGLALSGDIDPSTVIQGATEKIEGPGFAYNLGDTVTHREAIPGGSHQEWERPEAALEKIEIALADHPLADDVARVAGPGPAAGKSVVSGWGGELIDTNHAPADTFAADAAQEVPYGIDLVRDDGPTTLLGGDAALADPAVPQEQFSLNFTKVEFHGHDAEGSDGDGDGDAFMDYTDDVDL